MSEPARRHAPLVLYLLTLLSAYPIGALVARATPRPPGACSGIGFGCTLYGWDAAGFLLAVVGVPYAVGLAVVLALMSLLPGRWRSIQTGVAVVGLAVPWVVAGAIVASRR